LRPSLRRNRGFQDLPAAHGLIVSKPIVSNLTDPNSTPANSSPVLLTGATGFIGCRIQATLLNAGLPVRALVRPGSRHRSRVDPRCEVVEGALDDVELLSGAVAGLQAVVYCAGTVRGRTLRDFLPANVNGPGLVADALREQGSPAPILLISSLAAGRPGLSHYAHSKFLGEESLRGRHDSPWTILRPPATYGPGDTEMAPLLKLARRGFAVQFGPPGQRFSLLHVDDLAAAVLAWLKDWQGCSGQTFDIDDGRPGGYDWPAIVEAAGAKRYRALTIPRAVLGGVARFNDWMSGWAGYAPMLTPGKVRELTQGDWLCDNTAFVQATGWRPEMDLAAGVRNGFH